MQRDDKQIAHDPGVGSLIVARYHQYLYLDKLSPAPFFGVMVHCNFFLAFGFFGPFGVSPNQLGYGKHLATFFCGVHTLFLFHFWGLSLGVRHPFQEKAQESRITKD